MGAREKKGGRRKNAESAADKHPLPPLSLLWGNEEDWSPQVCFAVLDLGHQLWTGIYASSSSSLRPLNSHTLSSIWLTFLGQPRVQWVPLGRSARAHGAHVLLLALLG